MEILTEKERDAERVRSLASAVYRSLDAAQKEEDYVRQIAKRHSEHPAFKQYMSEMLLAERLAEFMSRREMTRR